jgi:hypothetical protein
MATFTLTDVKQVGQKNIPSLTLQSGDVTLLFGNATNTTVYTKSGDIYFTTQNAGTIAAAISFTTLAFTGGTLNLYTGQSLYIDSAMLVYAPSVVAVIEPGVNGRTVFTDYYMCESSASLATLKSGVGGGALIPDIPAQINNAPNSVQYWYNALNVALETTKATQVKLLKPLGRLAPYIFVSPMVTKTMSNVFTVTSGANTVISVTFSDIGTCTFGTPLNQSNTSGIASALNAFLVANQKIGTATATNPAAGTSTITFTNTSSVPVSASVRNNGTITTKYFA